MRAALGRIAVALGGAVGASFVVALVEAQSCAATAARPALAMTLLSDEVGVLAPLAAFVGLAVALFDLFLFPAEPRSIRQHFAKLRAEPVLVRSRTAAVAPLAVLSITAWTIASAQIARSILSEGRPAEAGIEIALASLATLAAISACALAVLRPLRRGLASGAEKFPRLLDPVTTGGAVLVLTVAVIAYGIDSGDPGGASVGVLGIFGVLKRRELDLRPVVDLFAFVVGAYAAPVSFARPRAKPGVVLVAALVAMGPLAWTWHVAHALNDDPPAAQAIERGAPLGKIALAVLRKATDRDHDGSSPLFGGGDCDDRNPHRNPYAVDIPGNGIDEDCTGADLEIPKPVIPARPSVNAEDRLPDDLNLVLVTIDTVRAEECGFMGYALPTTPHLDALAKESTVFDRAYAMASYTGKSLGPLLIGKYPSETARNGSHFTTYEASNAFITERLKKAGFHTMGAASHWYFNPWSGLSQGMDDYDLSAKPPGGPGDNDSNITSDAISNAVLRMLKKPESTSGRFFLWIHYFDPHDQYEPHEGAPNFAPPGAGVVAQSRAAYDGELWFTDEQLGRVLDFIQSADYGKKTAIVVTSDHGETFNEHGMSYHGRELWEPLVRVPLLVYVPGVKPHRIPVKRSHIDLVPTLLDILRVPQPGDDELSGQSMIGDILEDAPEADGGAPEYPERDVYIDMPVGPYTGMRRAIIHGPTPGMKLIHFGGNNYSLFDLATDPGETTDLAGDKDRFKPVFAALQAKRGSLHEIEPVEDKDSPP
ncbi:MAG: sulfatase-like hydrolase/transferase [Polyangiaceae bacterium]